MHMNTFKTQDFYLTAFLSAAGFPIIHFYRNSALTTFAFEENDELLELVREYYADHATVSPVRYGNSLKNLKCLIHSNYNGKSNTHNINAAE